MSIIWIQSVKIRSEMCRRKKKQKPKKPQHNKVKHYCSAANDVQNVTSYPYLFPDCCKALRIFPHISFPCVKQEAVLMLHSTTC